MDSLQAQDIAERDQLWASLRVLRPEIERLAQQTEALAPQDQRLAVLIAKILLAELEYRTQEESNI
jgi:hypothetical protein